jgi:hypothetical protein
MSPKDKDTLRCSFCGKPQDEVGKLINGPSVHICDDCVRVCNEILADAGIGEALDALGPTLSPDAGTFTCPKCRTTFTLHSQHAGPPGG